MPNVLIHLMACDQSNCMIFLGGGNISRPCTYQDDDCYRNQGHGSEQKGTLTRGTFRTISIAQNIPMAVAACSAAARAGHSLGSFRSMPVYKFHSRVSDAIQR